MTDCDREPGEESMSEPVELYDLIDELRGQAGAGQKDESPAAPQLVRLTVRGAQILACLPTGEVAVRIKGINRSGFQHRPSLREAGFGDGSLAAVREELERWRREWRVVMVRLPLAQDLYLQRPSYRAEVGILIEAAAAAGVYALLEIHGTSTDLNARQPDADTPALWDDLARRFGAQPHVLFDLWNEPHDVGWPEWRERAEQLLRTIRRAGAPETPVVVGGLDWAYDLSVLSDPDARIDEALGPVIYATHAYPWKGSPPHGPAEWQQRFGRVAKEVPVLVGEFGVDCGEDVAAGAPFRFRERGAAAAWLTSLLGYLDAAGLSALAWSAGDAPHLCEGSAGGRVCLPSSPPDPAVPTDPFGTIVRRWLGAG